MFRCLVHLAVLSPSAGLSYPSFPGAELLGVSMGKRLDPHQYSLLAPKTDLDAFLTDQELSISSSFSNPATFDGHLRIYPVLRCNLACAYCVNEEMGPTVKDYPRVEPEAWAQAINRAGRQVVLTGGEPFLYKGLEALCNMIDPQLKVRVYTNLCLDLAKRLSSLTRPVHFYVSWHPGQNADRERFLANIGAIEASLHLSHTTHAIEALESTDFLAEDLAWFADRNLILDLDPDQRGFAGSGQATARPALCRRKIILIGPDGARYQCVSKLMRAKDPLSNFLTGSAPTPIPTHTDAEELLSLCPEFGRCAPCDQLGQTRMDLLTSSSTERP